VLDFARDYAWKKFGGRRFYHIPKSRIRVSSTLSENSYDKPTPRCQDEHRPVYVQEKEDHHVLATKKTWPVFSVAHDKRCSKGVVEVMNLRVSRPSIPISKFNHRYAFIIPFPISDKTRHLAGDMPWLVSSYLLLETRKLRTSTALLSTTPPILGAISEIMRRGDGIEVQHMVKPLSNSHISHIHQIDSPCE